MESKMKKLLLLPVMIFPYSPVLGVLLGGLFSENVAPYIFGILLSLFFCGTPICNIIFMILSRNDDPQKLIRASLLVKLMHIPSYVCVFAYGAIASLMIFMTLPLILMFILFDCIVLFLSSMISVFTLAKNVKNIKTLSVVALICQFFFCADVISLFVLRLISKKQPQTIST